MLSIRIIALWSLLRLISYWSILTHWPMRNFNGNLNNCFSSHIDGLMGDISLVELLPDECDWTLLMINQHWFRCRQTTSHYLNQCLLRSMSSCGVTRSQWVKSNHCSSQLIWKAITCRFSYLPNRPKSCSHLTGMIVHQNSCSSMAINRWHALIAIDTPRVNPLAITLYYVKRHSQGPSGDDHLSFHC